MAIEQIGLKDNFFELGGHSLSVTKLISKIQKEYSIKISMNKIFEHPILEDQSRLIENSIIVHQNSINKDQQIEFENFSI
ncbi:MAG: hypothetical protein JKY08_07960 [Flavobacteriaceae bacterium]|nr:hypothetical protein [Flavobacteriaceae bacterium]